MKNLFSFIFCILLLASCSKDEPGNNGNSGNENNIPAPFSNLYNAFDGQGIGAAINLGDEIMLFFSADGEEYIWFEDQEIKKKERVDADEGLFDNMAFTSVGGTIDFEEERLVFFNSKGTTYQWADINPDLVAGGSSNDTLIEFSEFTYALWEWGPDNTCPFDELGAIFGFSKEPRGCDVVGDDDDFLWMSSDDGDQVVRYNKVDNVFEEAIELEQWRSESVCGGSPTVFPLNSIGAVCIYEPEGEDYRELYFSLDGSEMVVLNGTTGVFSEVYKTF